MLRDRNTRAPFLVLWLLLVAAAPGCIRTPTKSVSMKQAENLVDITSAQLRLELHDYTSRFDTMIVSSSNKIARDTDDPAIRRKALLWKMNVIPEVHRAAFQIDPLIGLIDTAVLCRQLLDFLTVGGGSEHFGDQQYIAVRAAQLLDEDVWKLARSITISGEPQRAREMIEQWASEHPIEDVYFLRESVQPLVARMQKGKAGGTGALIGGITETVNDLSDRLTIYADFLPRQARWQAELVLYDALEELQARDLLTITESMADSIARIADIVDTTPELIRAERLDTLKIMEEMVTLAFEEVDSQRVATIAELKLEREEITRLIEEHLETALSTIHTERVETVGQVEDLTSEALDVSFDRVDALVDRIFLRVLVLVSILAVAFLIAGVVAVFVLRPRTG